MQLSRDRWKSSLLSQPNTYHPNLLAERHWEEPLTTSIAGLPRIRPWKVSKTITCSNTWLQSQSKRAVTIKMRAKLTKMPNRYSRTPLINSSAPSSNSEKSYRRKEPLRIARAEWLASSKAAKRLTSWSGTFAQPEKTCQLILRSLVKRCLLSMLHKISM